MLRRTSRSYRLLPLVALAAAACGTDLGPVPPTGVCWVDFVQVDGIRYVGIDLTLGRDLVESDLGEQVATVEFTLYENVDDPEYQPSDGDAAFLEEGTPIHLVNGYASTFRLAAKVGDDILLYEADYNPAAGRGSDLLDLDGVVDSVGIFQSGNPAYRLGAIKDAAGVTEFVDMVLEAGVVEPTSQDGDVYFVAFHLDDGTTTVRPYWPESTRLGPYLGLPEAFNDLVYGAITAGPADPQLRLRSIGRVCTP